ncbi:hypothetical protein GYMLUDRAFT_53104 [Collybiopsis luxurians FD-317 M1]|nr:hypothetical protein GYMLUDRAFT_53104 [Collybiopsis luxurians FD-317 M1]
MAKDEKIDDRVSTAQCKKAVDALYSHVSKISAQKAETQLLPDVEPSFWLTVALKKQPQGSALKVFKIPVAHPIVDPRKESICLITKDPQRTYKDLLADNNINFIHRVVGISKLKGKFKAFDARRVLLKEHGLFLADDRVLPLLPKLLGSKFFEAKKQPLPVSITRKDLKRELERAISSTYMPTIRGTALSIKIGRLSQKPSQVLDNLKTALPAVIAKLNGGWDNVQGLGLKTSNSVNLPLWTCKLDDEEGGRWAGLTAEDEEDGDEQMDEDEVDSDEDVEMDEDDEESDSIKMVQETKIKGKKRAADTDVSEEAEKPKKKPKSSSDTGSLATKVLTSAAVDVPVKSKKSKAPVTTESSSKDDTFSALPPSLPKSKTKKAPAPEAPTPVNTPATAKRAVTDTGKSPSTVTKQKVAPVAPETPATKRKEKKAASAPGIMVEPTSTAVVAESASTKKSKKAPRASEADESTAAPDDVPTSKELSKKKNKSSVGANEVGDILLAAAKIAAQSHEVDSPQKKKKPVAEEKEKILQKGKQSDREVGGFSNKNEKMPAHDVADSIVSKKEKKAKKSNNDHSIETDKLTASETGNVKEKKKKGKKSIETGASIGDNSMTVDLSPASEPPSPNAPEKNKKDKKDTKAKLAVEEQMPTLSKDELKKKKSDAPGEKKKDKIVKAKAGKSAKDSLLGKKIL